MKPLNLKSITDCLNHSSVTIIAAAPSAGKSALAASLATQYGVFEEKNVVVFPLELRAEWAVEYISLCASGKKDMFAEKVLLEKAEYSGSATITLERSNIFIESDFDMSTTKIARHIEQKIVKCGGIDLVIIDYLRLMSWDKERYPSHDAYLRGTLRELDALAEKFTIPFVVTTHLLRFEHENKPITEITGETSISRYGNAGERWWILRRRLDSNKGEVYFACGENAGKIVPLRLDKATRRFCEE